MGRKPLARNTIPHRGRWRRRSAKSLTRGSSIQCRSCAAKPESLPPASLNEALSPEWAGSLEGANGNNKAVRVAALAADLRTWSPARVSSQALEHWNRALKSQSSTDRARLKFFTAAETLLSEPEQAGSCPLCRQPVDEEVLRGQLRSAIDELRVSAEELQRASNKVRAVALTSWSAARLR